VAEAVHDVAVVGGGLIGASAALGLARQGRRVLLVEPAAPRLQRGELGSDLRTVALSPASRALLESLDAWAGLRVVAYRRMEVWEERGTAAMHFDAAEVGRQELGWIVENSPIAVALWEALGRHPRVTRIEAPVSDMAVGPELVELAVAGQDRAARLVIAADGARSMVRESLGVAVRAYDVGQVALATTVRTARPHDGVAYQRFLLDGPLALLPGTGPRLCSVVWSQTPAQAQAREALEPQAFCAALERAIQGRLGAVEAVDRRLAFPLKQQLAASFNPHPRVLLVGDAARVVHPLSGLGANLGLQDVAELLATLADSGPEADPGSAGLWAAFDRHRGVRARLMLSVLGGLRYAYARGDPWSQWLRNAGVHWLDRLAPVKRQIMLEAMGLGPVAAAQ
jgi:2-octaprenylphenol hydroxylase